MQAVKRRNVSVCLGVYVIGVSNEQPLGICTWVGMATVLAYARVIYHGIYIPTRVCTAHGHVYSMLLVKGNSISKMSAEHMLYCSCES